MELSKFLYHIGKSVHMQYYSTVSKTDTSFAIRILNKIPGYKNVVEKAANFQDIKKMLDADNLVYIDGQAKRIMDIITKEKKFLVDMPG